MSDFVFLNLPENYRLVDALAAGKKELWWRTTRLGDKLAIGDRVFLWQGKGRQPQLHGIHAVAEIIEQPRILAIEEFDEYWVNETEKATGDPHTRLRVNERAAMGHQLRQDTIHRSILRDKGVFNGSQGINFSLSESEAQELYRLWQNHVETVPDDTDAGAAVVAVDTETKFDQTARSLLDGAAMGLLTKSLKELEVLLSRPIKDRDHALRPIKVAGRPRDPVVVAYARLRADNACEIKDCMIPLFETSTGLPFVEVHHIRPLGEGGPDVVENVACLCPSHHREAHHGKRSSAISSHLVLLREQAAPTSTSTSRCKIMACSRRSAARTD